VLTLSGYAGLLCAWQECQLHTSYRQAKKSPIIAGMYIDFLQHRILALYKQFTNDIIAFLNSAPQYQITPIIQDIFTVYRAFQALETIRSPLENHGHIVCILLMFSAQCLRIKEQQVSGTSRMLQQKNARIRPARKQYVLS